MNKRIKKKKHKQIKHWIIFRYANGLYNSLGVNARGITPRHAGPLKEDSKTLKEVIALFSRDSMLPVVELTKEEEDMLFYDNHITEDGHVESGNREEYGFWGEGYLLKRVKNGNCKWVYLS